MWEAGRVTWRRMGGWATRVSLFSQVKCPGPEPAIAEIELAFAPRQLL